MPWKPRITPKVEDGGMSHFFPPGVKVIYPYDTTPFTRVAIEEVFKALFEAVLLVFVVMWLFMGTSGHLDSDHRGAGGAARHLRVLGLFGFSINMLTMFAMVLAIGLLVDDTIVVVENVERIMSEEGLSPREATAKSMDQVTSALIGFCLVLSALFGPMAFFPGSTGVIYRQFSVTIVTSMLLSVGHGPDPDPGAVRDDPQAGSQGPSAGGQCGAVPAALFPLVRPLFFQRPGRCTSGWSATCWPENCATWPCTF
jgi:Cu/Ag efflux pump CusA